MVNRSDTPNSTSAATPTPIASRARRRKTIKAASAAAAEPSSDIAPLSIAELELENDELELQKIALLREIAQLAKKVYAARAKAKKLDDPELLQQLDALQREVTEIAVATSERGAFVYLVGYGAGGYLEQGAPRLPETRRLKPGSAAEQEGRMALADRLRAIAARNPGPDYALLLALAAKHDPEPRRDQPYEDGWVFDLRQRKRGRRKNSLANSKIAQFIYDGRRSGKFKSLPEAKAAASNMFALEESRIRAIWRAQRRVLLAADGPLPPEPRGAGVK